MKNSIPRHIAIIMDGNGRWAKKRFLPNIAGHRAGVNAARSAIEVCIKKEVEILTLFAFSSENWLRSSKEVGDLMELFFLSLKKEIKRLQKYNVRFRLLGDISQFNTSLQDEIIQAEMKTKDNKGLLLQVAASYGGQWDITQAVKKIAKQVDEGFLKVSEIDQFLIERSLSTLGQLSPDLCIRTGNEFRLSNFLLWQLAYTELYFSNVYWPDFKTDEMMLALEDYSKRQRRFGKVTV